MSTTAVYILGGYQTDFARNWTREGKDSFDLFQECLQQGLANTSIAAESIDCCHVGNFVGELFSGQSHLAGFFAEAEPGFHGRPCSRHEAACASGSMALLAAMRDIESGHYDSACVLGMELMRNVGGAEAADNLGAAAWRGREAVDANFLWPRIFADLYERYAERHGMNAEHIRRIAEINFANARRNPNAQTRNWQFSDASFSDCDDANPPIEGVLRKQDCGQISDGAAVLFLASESRARAYAREQGLTLEQLPRIKGWGHSNAAISLHSKLPHAEAGGLLLPHIRNSFDAALRRAGLDDVYQLDCLEVHDCFSMTEYLLIDHLGLTEAGQSWRAVEDGTIESGGRLPINPSGGLLGLGHPVGATGVRMMLDASKQVCHAAGDYQVDGARNVGIFNLGGSTTTCASFVVGRD